MISNTKKHMFHEISWTPGLNYIIEKVIQCKEHLYYLFIEVRGCHNSFYIKSGTTYHRKSPKSNDNLSNGVLAA